jgi:SulP family sulfate permease
MVRIRGDMEALPPRTVAYVVVDFGMVSGADSSAVISLTKLRHYCEQKGATLVWCSLSPAILGALERGGVLGTKSRHCVFDDPNLGLAWCEDELLTRENLRIAASMAEFESWLQRQVGKSVRCTDLLAYFERKEIAGSQVLYRRGEPADSVDLVASGSLAIDVAGGAGESLRRRRIMTHTVVGEMGSSGAPSAPPPCARTGRPRCSRSRATASRGCRGSGPIWRSRSTS